MDEEIKKYEKQRKKRLEAQKRKQEKIELSNKKVGKYSKNKDIKNKEKDKSQSKSKSKFDIKKLYKYK